MTDSKRIRDYKRGNFEAMRCELRAVNWEETLRGNTCEAWSAFKQLLLDLIDKHIPDKKLNVNKRSKAIWMTHRALALVKKRHKVCTKYKDIHHPAYRKAARAAHEAIRAAKNRFKSKLASNIKNDTKSFYAYVNSRSKARVKVGPLVGNGNIVSDAVDMADQLNDYFTSVFTRENLSRIPSIQDNTNAHLADIQVTPAKVMKKLERLRSDKAAGPDELSPRVLKEVTEEICEPLTVILFQLMKAVFPMIGGMPTLVLSTRKGVKHRQPITDP